jgi:Pyridoxamine 5'-phosphate oxidase
MAKTYDQLDERLCRWIADQRMFFVATAPSGTGGHVNLSPKGHADTFTILDERTVAYLDLTGSGAETIAHLRDNGRIVLMFCAFSGPPKILRLHGRGQVVLPEDGAWLGLMARFPARAAPGLWWSTFSASPTPTAPRFPGTTSRASATCSTNGPTARTTPPSTPIAPSATAPASTTSPPSR